MSKKTSKKDNTKLINIIILIGIVCLIISLVIMLKKREEHNHIVTINYNEYSEIINKDEYSIILLTTPTCKYCNKYKPQVNQVCEENNLTVYNLYINELSYEEYMEIHDKYSAIKDSYMNENTPTILTPTTIITRNGEEVASVHSNIGYEGFLNLLKENDIIKE